MCGDYHFLRIVINALPKKHDIAMVFHFLLYHPQYLQQQDEMGETPLFCAIHDHDAKMVQSLVRCGSLLDVRNNTGDTPLITSILEKQEPIALSFASLSRLGPNNVRVY